MNPGLAHIFGDYVVQNDWMAAEKTTDPVPAAVHAATYTACFLPLTRNPKALAVIGGTHFVIDRWRLARHLVWARNQAAPLRRRYPAGTPFGAPEHQPDWLAGWLLFIADNAVHMLINDWALTHWQERVEAN